MSEDSQKIRVELMPNGPLVVQGNLSIKDANGIETEKTGATYFCRCGHSNNKPFCDASHRKSDFKG